MSRTISAMASIWLSCAATPVEAQIEGLEGAWTLEAYRTQEADVPVSGVMIFAGGHFAMVYSMELEGWSGRGHGGTYRLDGDVVTFEIPWWVEHVSGKSQVMKETIEASGRLERNGDRLVLRLASGSVQRFLRAPRAEVDELAGSWLMESYESRAKTGATSGMITFADDHFALLYTMRRSDGSLDGRAHAGRYEKDDESVKLLVDWSMQVISGAGSVDEQASERATTISVSGDVLTLELGGGAVQKFRRARRAN